jgi:hypothetical protein
MTIIAKPVIDKQYWILKQDNKKVGIIEAVADGFAVKIRDNVSRYKTIKMAGRDAGIEFEKAEKAKAAPTNQVHGYEVTGRVYNPLWNVQLKLPLFTRDTKSKSWFAAGWYMVKQHRNWKLVQTPKLITLERYKYQGPFHTKEEANDKSVS